MAARRLQEAFEAFDQSGDGILSDLEMRKLLKALGFREEDAGRLVQAADGNQDGKIQVHEFLAWIAKQEPLFAETVHDGAGSIDVTLTNTSDRTRQIFTLTFSDREHVACPEGNPVSLVLNPGETLTKTVLLVQGEPFTYSWRMACRSEFTSFQDDPEAFVDPEFPHDETSIGHCGDARRDLGHPERWVRGRMLGDPREAALFETLRPENVAQGKLGDCWLLTALSSLAAHPAKLKSLFDTKHLTADGKYGIWLFDLSTKTWAKVVVDEFIPCDVLFGEPRPTFAQATGEELWVLLLEKAMAKWCGSYGALDGGQDTWAFMVLTGQSEVECLRKRKEGGWNKCRSDPSTIHAHSPHGMRWRWTSGYPFDEDKLFRILKDRLIDKHVLSCRIYAHDKSVEAKLPNGLVCNHAYALLQVLEETLDNGDPVKLVQCRNPWGTGEWKGDWADFDHVKKGVASRRWQENPRLQQRLEVGRKNNGSFFMSFEEFSGSFNRIYVCPCGDRPIEAEELAEEAEGEEHPGFLSRFFSWSAGLSQSILNS